MLCRSRRCPISFLGTSSSSSRSALGFVIRRWGPGRTSSGSGCGVEHRQPLGNRGRVSNLYRFRFRLFTRDRRRLDPDHFRVVRVSVCAAAACKIERKNADRARRASGRRSAAYTQHTSALTHAHNVTSRKCTLAQCNPHTATRTLAHPHNTRNQLKLIQLARHVMARMIREAHHRC
jgi:hypothetical protein